MVVGQVNCATIKKGGSNAIRRNGGGDTSKERYV